MDFSLMLSPQQTELQLAQSRDAILATNQLAFTLYGLQLTADEAAMIAETGSRAVQEEDLVEFGAGIAPRLIHWFLPTGWLGTRYAEKLAELSEAFYRIRGRLQSICDEAGENGCMLSDNAILFYMYHLFIAPSCMGDIDVMAEQADQIICGAMQRLVNQRAAQRKARQSALHTDDAERMLYADELADEFSKSDAELRYEEELYEDEYAGAMEDAEYASEGGVSENGEQLIYGTYAEELEAVLRRNPEMLIPSRRMEAEWDSAAEEWEEADEAAAKAAEAALNRKEP